jgi:S1-C subfamily serine protease
MDARHIVLHGLILLVLFTLNLFSQEPRKKSPLPGSAKAAEPQFDAVKAKALTNDANAQLLLGWMYDNGSGVVLDHREAFKWYLKAAEQGIAVAQHNVAVMYAAGQGVAKDDREAVKWYRKASDQGFTKSQANLGWMDNGGRGLDRDKTEAYYNWWASGQREAFRGKLGLKYGSPNVVISNANEHFSRAVFAELPDRLLYLTADGICCDQEKLSDLPQAVQKRFGYSAQKAEQYARRIQNDQDWRKPGPAAPRLLVGTGFFVSEDGYMLTCYHLVENARKIKVAGESDSVSVEAWDAENDLAILKLAGSSSPLALADSRAIEVGEEVMTVGYPNVMDQGFSQKTTFGRINSKFGLRDNPRGMQISTEVQQGNSGGALVDKRGNVVGIVGSRLGDWKSLLEQGLVPQNVNYAIKSEHAITLLNSFQKVRDKLKPTSAAEKADIKDVGESVRTATRMIVVEE